MKIYFGTYTRRASQGIYQADFDPKTGGITQVELAFAEPSPTYLALAADQTIYSVGAKEEQGGIVAIRSDFQLLNHVVEEGAPHCYVAVDEARQFVYAANYHKGQVLVYRRLADGQLEQTDCIQQEGSGPHPNQTSSHVHFANLTPDNYLITCDLGADRLVTYTVSDAGKLSVLSSYQTQEGAGPRHIVFHPTTKLAYLICELNSTIEVLIYDGLGQFERMQVISTLPKEYDGFNATAAIRISSDGRFVYASNRGHDSIAIYQVLADASLQLLDIVPSLGNTPRDCIFSPEEDFLIVPHQDSDNVVVFARNEETGLLSPLTQDTIVPEAVCVTF